MAEIATLYEFNQQAGQGVRATQNKNLTEQLLDGEVSVSVASGHVTLSTTPLDTAQVSYATIRLTGAPGAARNVLLPSGKTGKRNFINDTTGGQIITVKTTAGGSTGVAIPSGGLVYTIYSDGTNCKLVGNGGDADTLDGHDSTYFAPAAATTTALAGKQSNERRILTVTGDTTASSDDLKVRLLVLRGSPAADSVLTLPNEEFLILITNETGVDITVTRATSGVTDSLPPEPDTTATRLYKWIP